MQTISKDTPKDTSQDEEVTLNSAKFSYMWPMIAFIISLPLFIIQGIKPYQDFYKKRYWIPVKAELTHTQLTTKDAKSSKIIKNTGSVYKIKLTFKYSPRSIFGKIALSSNFPAWLRLPGSYFYWTESPETFTSYIDAKKFAIKLKFQHFATLYMNPSNPKDVQFIENKNYTFIKLGILMFVVSFLWFGLIWVLNSRSERKAYREHLAQLNWQANRESRKRHHNKH